MLKKTTNVSPIIYDYLRKFQDDPSSRIFAPLAEAYRKSGLVDEAIKIAHEGLAVHPTFVGGRVALARALFDKKLYFEVIAELSPVVQEVPDNLVAQRVLAESCLMVGRFSEALGAYKMLLYFTPDDTETAKLVQEIEAQAYEKGTLTLRTDPVPTPDFSIQSAQNAIQSDPSQKRLKWIEGIEALQTMLQRVERYRLRHVAATE